MKILLLGAMGQLGSEWQQWGDQVEDVLTVIPYTSSQLDITAFNQVKVELEDQQPDIVINCAAYTDVDRAEEQRELAHAINVEAVDHLAKLSKELDFMLIHYSTDYVFAGRKEDRQVLPEGYPEDHPADPVNYYGLTKWEGEEAIRKHTDNHLILRVSWLCGEYGSNFVKTLYRLAQEQKEIKVVNDQWGSPTFTENVVDNTWELFDAGKTGTYHITSRGLITWYDFAKEIFSQSGIEVELKAVPSEEFPTKAERPAYSKLATNKLSTVDGANIVEWKNGLQQLLYKIS